MAREARLAMADMRALQKESKRQEMHGGAFHGAGVCVGGGGVPSMGVSQFRGGARRRRKHHESSSENSEEEMHGGAWYSNLGRVFGSTAARVGAQEASAAERASTALALRGTSSVVPYSAAAASESLAARLAALNTPASRALALRAPGTIKPYNPAEAAFRLGSTAPTQTMAARLAAMGITPARAAAALAAGVAIGSLADYFANEAHAQSGDAGYYEPPPGPAGPGPRRPGGPGGPGGPIIDDGTPQPRPMTKSETSSYLKTGNIPRRFLIGSIAQNQQEAAMEGMGKAHRGSDGRSARAAVVRKVMAEHGMSLPAASKYVKEHGLYRK